VPKARELKSSHFWRVCSDELRDDDIALKLNSIRRLSTIALALGEVRTRNELLPYLLESTPEEDELLVALAEEVGNMVPLVGGPAQAPTLVPLLESLAKEEETVVRDAAVASLCKVGSTFSRAQAVEHFVPCIRVRILRYAGKGTTPRSCTLRALHPVACAACGAAGHVLHAAWHAWCALCMAPPDACVHMQRLKTGEWFTNRVSVCGLFATACELFATDTAVTQDLCTLFRDLCRDDTPMVRRAAASNIGSIAAAVDSRTVQQVRQLARSTDASAAAPTHCRWASVRAAVRRSCAAESACVCMAPRARVIDCAVPASPPALARPSASAHMRIAARLSCGEHARCAFTAAAGADLCSRWAVWRLPERMAA
jgi:HEAT repeat